MNIADGYGLDAAVHVLPKVHLHCHLEGTLRPAAFRDLAALAGVEVAAGDPYDFVDFAGFLQTFMSVCKVLRVPQDYARLAREFVEGAREENALYGELFISPSAWAFFHPTLDIRAAIAAIARELRADPEREFALIVDVTRNLGVESALGTVELAAECKALGVVGIGLGGDEVRFPAELFESVFDDARERGLHTVAHAGEAAGAQSVRAAVEILRAQRIGHGIAALNDPAVLELLVARQVALEVCPTSNVRTGAVSPGAPHPIFGLVDAGVRVVVDADDPALFGTSIEGEYRYVARQAGLPTLRQCIDTAIDASFATPHRKEALRAALADAGRS
ncbi:MAG: adenosine deaminase [Candidatus Tyrphobacter sp.]